MSLLAGRLRRTVLPALLVLAATGCSGAGTPPQGEGAASTQPADRAESPPTEPPASAEPPAPGPGPRLVVVGHASTAACR